MKTKWYSLLLVGLVILLATSVMACNQPAPTTQDTSASAASTPETTAIQPTPRTLVQTGPSLTIPLKVGERVEVEVSSSTGSTTIGVVVSVIDPYGNEIGHSAERYQVLYSSKSGSERITRVSKPQSSPWRFAFIAATEGDYILKGFGDNYMLKAIIYP